MRPRPSRAPSSDLLRARSPSPAPISPQSSNVPTIRLVSATASAAGTASDANNTFASTTASSSFVAVPYPSSPLAPRVEEPPRRKLVPKKSKPGLLGVGGKAGRERGRDMSDMLRRVTGDSKASSSARDGFEIYVDPTTDPDFGEIVVVKKKKSRGALNTLGWGGTSSNICLETAGSTLLKPKAEEKDKWWSIGRGRKDSKDGKKVLKENVKPVPTPVNTEPLATRNRYNTLDSGAMLGSKTHEPQRTRSISSAQLLCVPDLVTDDQLSGSGSPDEVLTPTLLSMPNAGTGSIAVRAMRSMRSMAHLASWSQPKSLEKEELGSKKKEREKEDSETKKRKKKEKKEKKEDGRKATIRNYSGSSFEAGAPMSPVGEMFPQSVFPDPKRKASMLGLGLPSTLRFGSTRTISTASSTNGAGVSARAPSRTAESSTVNLDVIPSERRPSSTISTGSSLRPPSTISANSRVSSSSSVSVRWDEHGLETVKEQRRHERETAKPTETRRASDGRRRAALTDIFPGAISGLRPPSQSSDSSVPMPIVTIEEATADGHSVNDSASYETPSRRRPRPVSEQMLVKERPKAICEDGDGVLSMLDAATNDLASLISRLDLEASPGTPDCSPLRLSPSLSKLFHGSPRRPGAKEHGSPIRKAHSSVGPDMGLRASQASVTSLRPYAQSRGKAIVSNVNSPRTWSRIGQQIAPWPVSPTKPLAADSRREPVAAPPVPTFMQAHHHAPSPTPMEDVHFVLPLRPASRKAPQTAQLVGAQQTAQTTLQPPVFRRAGAQLPPPPLHLHTKLSMSSLASVEARTPIAPEARRGLGTAGTLGGSVGSVDADRLIESDDPDSDIPDELQVILSSGETEQFEETMSFNPSFDRPLPSPGSPPGMPLPTPDLSASDFKVPTFRATLVDEGDISADIDGIESDEDGTKRSFDFTSELKLLNESADRKSFVEQLETAFRTPAKFDLDGFGKFSMDVDVPPLPQSFSSDHEYLPDQSLGADASLLLPGPEISIPHRERRLSSLYNTSLPRTTPSSPTSLSFPRTVSSAATNFLSSSSGELNINFKFGGKPSAGSEHTQLTLSDIIPPPDIQTRLSMASTVEEDSSVLNSILAKAEEVPPPLSSAPIPRRRASSDASSRFFERDSYISYRDSFNGSGYAGHSSQASFSGLESFDEIRRGFEFGPDRPAFYPPPTATSRRGHNTRESVFSIASISSYGVVLNPGVPDPFDYGRYDLPSRPSSDGFSLSMSISNTVDDTFDFMQHRDSRRRRVDSDASSFYFRPPAPPGRRPLTMFAHRREESNMSSVSIAPPVSLYNRSFNHRRMESNSSAGSAAHAFAMGAQRMSWGQRHRRDVSMDSVLSDLSMMRVSRPGLSGDKMLESAQGVPLTAISASPPGSLRSERFNRSSAEYDSIMDGTRAVLAPSAFIEDSLFDRTGYRTSASSESLFGGNGDRPQVRAQLQAAHYRPVSIYSINEDTQHSMRREDDTMVTMLDGNHVRRRSVDSVIGGSPCVRVGKRKHAAIRGPQDHIAGSDGEVEHIESPNKTRLVEKPSIAASLISTSSQVFGDERMIRARHGLLKRESLEESCLEADGEDLSCSFSLGPVFARPGPAARPRSSTYSSSSGADTPPLSVCDSSQSSSSDSQSSIDIAGLHLALANMTHPITSRTRVRTHRRGYGHRVDRSARQSVYETIVEETAQSSPAKTVLSPKPAAQISEDDVMVVDSDTMSVDWDEENNVVALRKYYALRDEAHVTVEDSKRIWSDTPFSLFAMQSFKPPAHAPAMRALLEYSQENYGPLPRELHPRRSRTSSRTSPYPAMRAVKRSLSPAAQLSFELVPPPVIGVSPPQPPVLQDRTQSANTPFIAKDKDQTKRKVKNSLPEGEISPFVPENMSKMSNGLPRPRVGSNARRSALGWAKRSAGKENKENRENRPRGSGSENVSFGIGTGATPGELRFSRPRPRGRPTPASSRPTSIRI